MRIGNVKGVAHSITNEQRVNKQAFATLAKANVQVLDGTNRVATSTSDESLFLLTTVSCQVDRRLQKTATASHKMITISPCLHPAEDAWSGPRLRTTYPPKKVGRPDDRERDENNVPRSSVYILSEAKPCSSSSFHLIADPSACLR